MPEIVISEFMNDVDVAGLSLDYDVLYDPQLVHDPERLAALVGDCRGLIVRNRTMVTAFLITAAPRLEVIGRLGVGLDNIDLDAAAARGSRSVLRSVRMQHRSPNMPCWRCCICCGR